MPRRLLIRQNQFPYHVTSRSRNKEWYDLDLNLVWKLALESLKVAKSNCPAKLHSFVLMNNHYHLIITVDNGEIDSFMYEFNKNLSLRIREHSRRINQIFGSRYKWLILNNNKILLNFVRYVYRNPVKALICSQCEFYPFSSLRSNKNFFEPLFVYDHSYLRWFNSQPSHLEDEAIKSSLKSLGEVKIRKCDQNKGKVLFSSFVA